MTRKECQERKGTSMTGGRYLKYSNFHHNQIVCWMPRCRVCFNAKWTITDL